MPKKPQGNDYRMSVDHVIETGQVTADQKMDRAYERNGVLT
jgi:hypothetical protein